MLTLSSLRLSRSERVKTVVEGDMGMVGDENCKNMQSKMLYKDLQAFQNNAPKDCLKKSIIFITADKASGKKILIRPFTYANKFLISYRGGILTDLR